MAEALYEISGAQEVAIAFRQAPDVVEKVGMRALIKATALLEREIKERTPFGVSGLLRQSISAHEPYRSGFDNMIGVVATPLNYAVPVELGSKPHYPPIEPIKEWVVKKLGISFEQAESVARTIAFKIKAHGTKGAFMFAKGFEANKAQVQQILGQVPQQIAEEIKRKSK